MDLSHMGPTVFGQIPLGKTGKSLIKFPAGLGCYGVQNQRAFPRTGDTGYNRDGVLGDLHRNMLKIVLNGITRIVS